MLIVPNCWLQMGIPLTVCLWTGEGLQISQPRETRWSSVVRGTLPSMSWAWSRFHSAVCLKVVRAAHGGRGGKMACFLTCNCSNHYSTNMIVMYMYSWIYSGGYSAIGWNHPGFGDSSVRHSLLYIFSNYCLRLHVCILYECIDSPPSPPSIPHTHTHSFTYIHLIRVYHSLLKSSMPLTLWFAMLSLDSALHWKMSFSLLGPSVSDCWRPCTNDTPYNIHYRWVHSQLCCH